MKLLNSDYWILAVFIFLITLPAESMAQPAESMARPVKIPFHREIYFVNSGLHDGPAGPGAEAICAYREVIVVPGAHWLRLQFQELNLE